MKGAHVKFPFWKILKGFHIYSLVDVEEYDPSAVTLRTWYCFYTYLNPSGS